MSGRDTPTSVRQGEDPFFATSHLKHDLAQRSVRGGLTTMGTQGAKFVLNLISTVILARLLIPEDFGLFAMVTPIVGLISLCQDFGLSTATVQRQVVSPDQATALFWVNMAVSAILAAVTALLAPLTAWFYDEPRLLWIMYAFAVLMLFGGFTAQHLAIFQRQMRFKRLAVIELVSLVMSYGAGVAGAWLGLTYWSLVLMLAAKTLTQVALVGCLTEWWPGRLRRGSGVRSMIRFGQNLTIVNIGFYLIRNLDNVLIGRVWGEQVLGLYSKAYGLLLLPLTQINGPISNIAIPVLSRLQNDPERYRAYYLKGTSVLAGITMPIVTFLTVDAEILIRIILGEKWLAAIPIFQALGPAAFMSTFSGATAWVFISLGMPNRQLRWVVFVQCPVVVLSFFAGLPFGAAGVALAYSVATVILRVPAVIYCFRGTPLRLADLARALLPSAVASLVAGVGLLGLRHVLSAHDLPTLVLAALHGAILGLLYAAVYCALPTGRSNVRMLFALIRAQAPAGSAGRMPA